MILDRQSASRYTEGTPYRGSRCARCYWALYDGDWCQNRDCVCFGQSVEDNRVYLSNEEALLLINMRFAQDILWTELSGTTTRVSSGWCDAEDDARQAAKSMAVKMGWTPPKWWQFWRWNDTRLSDK